MIATGGTITGYSQSRLDYKDYVTGSISVTEILEAVPEINELAEIEVEPFQNVSSCEMNPSHWRVLKQKIENDLNENDFDGVVITHGTSTMEETAYFLHLTVKTEKPVVLVGSQRPFSALGSDALINVINGVRVAVDPTSRGKGVLLVSNDEINSAREGTKTNTYRLEAFQSGQFGFLGYVDPDGTVQFYRSPVRKHTINSCFSSAEISYVPEVAIVYSYAGASGDMIRFINDSDKYHGIVIAGSGAGLFSTDEKNALVESVNKGITVVRSSRAGNGRVVDLKTFGDIGFISGDNLLPQKARILLMLSLMMKKNRHDIQNVFNEY